MVRRNAILLLVVGMWSAGGGAGAAGAAESLEHQLQRSSPAELAAQARAIGDPARGAVVFFQPHLACSQCHSVKADAPSPLGPVLVGSAEPLSDAALVEAVLFPSRQIRRGYEAVTVVTRRGTVLSGILQERTAEQLILRDAARGGSLTVLPAAEVEEVRDNPLSLMPAGQVNQLASPQPFFDLIRYLLEIRDGGATRAAQLQPSPALLVTRIPEYEQRIDHAGMIREWNDQSLRRGAAIYQRVCRNCHGTREEPGSLPTAPRFSQAVFKNGSDPLALYQTLTRGFGMMAAQTWMVPAQKYDVIHYLRETFLRPEAHPQFREVDEAYLAGLPAGDTRGPAPSKIEAWSAMDYGPSLTHTYQLRPGQPHFAYKGVAVRLDAGPGGVARGRFWMVFDTDTLRIAAGWRAEPSDAETAPSFINWRAIQFNGEHNIHPQIVGDIGFDHPPGPGWADPATGDFGDNQRVVGRDGRRYGPLPRAWGQYRGLYHHGQEVVFAYRIGQTEILESPQLVGGAAGAPAYYLRILQVGPRPQPLRWRAPQSTGGRSTGILPQATPVTWQREQGEEYLMIPAGDEPLAFAVWIAADDPPEHPGPQPLGPVLSAEQLDLRRLTRGGPPRWTQVVTTRAVLGDDSGPFAADTWTPPEQNPWLAQTRFTGLDFFSDGALAVCSWDGDVWVVRPRAGDPAAAAREGVELDWRRIASGLFQPLGIKVIRDQVHVLCRDQLAVLRDLNGDGETDFYECLNHDHQVTEHFHEFAMGLQTDAAGNFYYAKSARHALPAIVPHHGTLLRIAPDGSRTDILANGFRAANGVCLNPDGSFVVTDQEGHWNPKNRINWVTVDESGKPKFYGNLLGYTEVTDPSDDVMEPPLCWITNQFDRSPAELLWVESPGWGPLNGSLLNLSYGFGRVYVVPHERIGGVMQGGMQPLPVPAFPTGVMRGRFHPADGHLYLCGMFAWAGSATHPGGLYRLRATGKPMHVAAGVHATHRGLLLELTDPIARDSLTADQVQIKTWSLKRTKNYGSQHYDERSLRVSGVTVSADGRSVFLEVPEIAPTWCMEIRWRCRGRAGEPVEGVLQNTIHTLGPAPRGFPASALPAGR